ncbi:hypothetical protein SDC9_141255 [bioreactor metagenome]|uniref:Uncharacterized protein n=1 Tax=bioreactor metagenome TaxID=1076179 RepID=A0A645E0J5_9ZZZZ
MSGGEGAVVTGIHGLQHIKRLTAAHLANDDAVRPHTQRVSHKIAYGDLPGSFEICRACL